MESVSGGARTSCCLGALLVLASVGSALVLASGSEWRLEPRFLVALAAGLLGGVLILRGILVSAAAILGDSTLLVSGRPPGPDVLSVPEDDRAEGSGRRDRIEGSDPADDGG